MNVSQLALTVQGEGYNLGVPSVLVRLTGCNLCCNFCDTKWALNQESGHKYSVDELYQLLTINYITKFNTLPNIMITGGEPFIYYDELIDLFSLFNSLSDKLDEDPCFDIETNGTLITLEKYETLDKLDDIYINFNISPKLDPKCYPNKNIKTLKDIISYFKNDTSLDHFLDTTHFINYNFKFIHMKESENDIIEFCESFKIDRSNIYCMSFMPDPKKGSLKLFDEKFHKNNLDTVGFCIENGFRYTPRQHIYLFGTGAKEYKSEF